VLSRELSPKSFAFPCVATFCALIALATLGLGGCAKNASDVTNSDANKKDPPNASDVIRSADLRPRYPQATSNADTADGSAAPMSYFGTPVEAVAKEPSTSDGKNGFALNFDNTPVATVAKVVLGDILGVGYVIDPRAQGTISLSSGRPVAKKDMLFVLENALRANNLVLVRDTVGYRILPAGEGTVGGADRAGSDGNAEAGYGITVIPVQYVSGQTLVKLLEGFASKPGTIRTDPTGRLLLVLGSGAERQAAIDTVRSFDVDWLRGQSVGIYPVHNSTPEPVVAELEKIMDSGESGLGHNLVKFQAIARQNAIMVVAAKPEWLSSAATWISRLDASATASTGVKVYRVKYGDARQIAALLANIFEGGPSNGGLESPANQIAPSSGATTLSAVDRLTGGPQKQEAPIVPARAALDQGQGPDSGGAGAANAGALAGRPAVGAGALPGVRITPDVANNAILIYADQESYRIIERALIQLDRPKLQVAIDVTIAEVTLNDDLSYGVQFFLSNKLGSLINSTGTSTSSTATSTPAAVTSTTSTTTTTGTTTTSTTSTPATSAIPPLVPNLPGFNLVVGNSATPQVILSALHQYTDVKILSNPSLVVVDNQPATLEVGDQVPVSTGTATVLSANNAVVSTVDYKNTGIILHVQPRVNSNGNVLLDIEQEISSVPNSSSSLSTGVNLTPTISERKVKSELSVASGQTVLLAGLISESQSITNSGIPVLDQIPLLGSAFSSKDKSIARTELILFIRPQVIRDGADASVVAEELRSKMRGGSVGSLGLPDLFAPDAKRTLQ
jgi:general secretion pathway protein D